MVFPVADILIERIRHGHMDPIGLIALVGIGVGLGGALAFHGNDLLLKLRDSDPDRDLRGGLPRVPHGAARPAMYFLARMFAASGDAERLRPLRRDLGPAGGARGLPAGHGRVGHRAPGRGGRPVSLALTLDTQTFLAMSPVVAWIGIGSLIAYTIRRPAQGRGGPRRCPRPRTRGTRPA